MPPAPWTIGSTITAATSRWWALSSRSMASRSRSSHSPSKRQPGRGANSCWGRERANSECMPVTGSQTDMAWKVSPW